MDSRLRGKDTKICIFKVLCNNVNRRSGWGDERLFGKYKNYYPFVLRRRTYGELLDPEV
jgi:hypothetical protein